MSKINLSCDYTNFCAKMIKFFEINRSTKRPLGEEMNLEFFLRNRNKNVVLFTKADNFGSKKGIVSF